MTIFVKLNIIHQDRKNHGITKPETAPTRPDGQIAVHEVRHTPRHRVRNLPRVRCQQDDVLQILQEQTGIGPTSLTKNAR